MFKSNEFVQDVVEGGGRALAALALVGSIGAGLYTLDRHIIADHHASDVESCADYQTQEAQERCIDNADGLRFVAGSVAVVVGGVSLIAGGMFAIDGAATMFGYDRRKRRTSPDE